MSRRTTIAGLVVSSLALVLTVLAIASTDTSLPGPSVGSWLGIADPEPPEPCEFDPEKVRHPAGRQVAGSWRPEPRSPSSAPELGATHVGPYLYLVGGQSPEGAERTILRFDPKSRRYRRVGELPVALDHPVVTSHGEDVVVAGGYVDGTRPTNRAWTFTPRSGEVRELPPMRFPRGAAAGTVDGDRLYVAGGLVDYGNRNEPRRSLQIYDFESGEWAVGPDMPTARHHFGAAVVGRKLYFAGGRQPSDLSLAAFEEFDPRRGGWRRLAPLPVGTGAPGVTAGGGKVIVVGGGEDEFDPSGGHWVLPTVYAYDPRMRRWSRLPDMRKPRHGLAVAVAGDRLYAFRGSPCPGYGRMASAESLELR